MHSTAQMFFCPGNCLQELIILDFQRATLLSISRKVVHSIAQICFTFQRICASRNLKYYISGNLCTRELKAQNFQEIYAFKSSKCHMVCASRSSNTRNFCIREPQVLQRICAPESSRYYIFKKLCLQALAEPTPLLATLPDHWLHSCQSRWPNFGTPHSQNLAVKECFFVPRGICGVFFMKVLVATFHGNQRMKMSEDYDQNFDAFFEHVGENFRLNFAIRDYVQKFVESTDSCRFLCLCLVTYTHRRTQKAHRGEKLVTVTNSEIQI